LALGAILESSLDVTEFWPLSWFTRSDSVSTVAASFSTERVTVRRSVSTTATRSRIAASTGQSAAMRLSCHVGLSLSWIGVSVACTGRFQSQPLPRSAPMSHPAGRSTDAELSVTALPR
jgi:hypothetical protein